MALCNQIMNNELKRVQGQKTLAEKIASAFKEISVPEKTTKIDNGLVFQICQRFATQVEIPLEC